MNPRATKSRLELSKYLRAVIDYLCKWSLLLKVFTQSEQMNSFDLVSVRNLNLEWCSFLFLELALLSLLLLAF